MDWKIKTILGFPRYSQGICCWEIYTAWKPKLVGLTLLVPWCRQTLIFQIVKILKTFRGIFQHENHFLKSTFKLLSASIFPIEKLIRVLATPMGITNWSQLNEMSGLQDHKFGYNLICWAEIDWRRKSTWSKVSPQGLNLINEVGTKEKKKKCFI